MIVQQGRQDWAVRYVIDVLRIKESDRIGSHPVMGRYGCRSCFASFFTVAISELFSDKAKRVFI